MTAPADNSAREDRKALFGKLLRARKAVQPIEKSGENKDGGYDYVEAVAVVEEANRVLSSRGVLILPSLEDSQSTVLAAGVLSKARITYEIIDVDTGYSFERRWVGFGFDSPGDKAIYQATTGATKYFLAGLLSIPFVGRDPEHDGEQAGEPFPEPGESLEAERIRAEQDQTCDPPEPPARHERPLPESDLPTPDWDGIAKGKVATNV